MTAAISFFASAAWYASGSKLSNVIAPSIAAREAVLHAKLSVEGGAQFRAVDMRQPKGMDQRLHAGNIACLESMFTHEHQDRIDAAVGAVAAWIQLDADARIDDVPRGCPVQQGMFRIEVALPIVDVEKPCLCSKASMLAVKPSRAIKAAINPCLAACPTWKGFVMVPKFTFTPLDSDTESANAVAVCSTVRPRYFAHAAAAPNTPSVAVGCHPLS